MLTGLEAQCQANYGTGTVSVVATTGWVRAVQTVAPLRRGTIAESNGNPARLTGMRRLLPPAATRTISDWASQADPKGVLRNFDPESTKKAAHPSRPLGRSE